MQSHLQPALHRTLLALNELPDGSVVQDRFGHAWQCSRNYWYWSYGDDSEVSSWDIVSLAPFTLMEPAAKPLANVKVATRKGVQ